LHHIVVIVKPYSKIFILKNISCGKKFILKILFKKNNFISKNISYTSENFVMKSLFYKTYFENFIVKYFQNT